MRRKGLRVKKRLGKHLILCSILLVFFIPYNIQVHFFFNFILGPYFFNKIMVVYSFVTLKL